MAGDDGARPVKLEGEMAVAVVDDVEEVEIVAPPAQRAGIIDEAIEGAIRVEQRGPDARVAGAVARGGGAA